MNFSCSIQAKDQTRNGVKGQHHEQDESQTHNLETLDWSERDEELASHDGGQFCGPGVISNSATIKF